MKISNRLLIWIVAFSATLAVILVLMNPGGPVPVFRATRALTTSDVITLETVKTGFMPLAQFTSNHDSPYPASFWPLIKGRHPLVPVRAGEVITLRHVAPLAGGIVNGVDWRRGHLAQILKDRGWGDRAVALPSEDIMTFEKALEPGDVIDLVYPGAGSGRRLDRVRVIAVGGRSIAGWVAAGSMKGDYSTITLALSVDQAHQLADLSVNNAGARPRVILHAAEGSLMKSDQP